MERLLRLGERVELWPSPLAIEGEAVMAEPNAAIQNGLEERGIRVRPMCAWQPGSTLVVPMSPLDELVLLVDRLLGPGGCPWDQAQTHETLKQHLLEEAYEVLDAIDSGSPDKLTEELGDLLLQPVMHGQMDALAEKPGTQEAAARVVDKLIRRHPHVFGDRRVSGADEVLQNWDAIKSTEAGEARSVLAGLPKGMASLLRAHEVSKRAARAGFEWPDLDGVWDKLAEEEHELRAAIAAGDSEAIEAELGDLLFTVVNLARWTKVEPEEALRKMVNRFASRFEAMEASSAKPLAELSPDEWEELWARAKASE